MLLSMGEEFHGACLDTGAERTVIVKAQAEAYIASIDKRVALRAPKVSRRYRIGGYDFVTVGEVHIRVPVAKDFFIPLEVKVIDLNVPLLLGVDTLDLYRMYVNNVTNRLIGLNESVTTPLVRKIGHIYLEWGADILYTFSELQRIHRHV